MPGLIPAIAAVIAAVWFPTTASTGGQDAGQTDIVATSPDSHGRMTVPVRIGEHGIYRFLVDTGAQNTVVSSALAARLSLVSNGRASVTGVAGAIQANTVRIDSLELGRRSFDNLIAPVLRQQDIGADGIVGVDSLQDQRVLLDFSRNLIVIGDANRSSDSNFDIIVRARRKSGQLIITRARIDGVAVDVVVDTGADSTIGNRALQREFARRKLRGTGILQSVTGQELTANIGMARVLALGDANLYNVSIAYADAPPFARLGLEDRPAILLGIRELRAFKRVAIDFPNRRVMFDMGGGMSATLRPMP